MCMCVCGGGGREVSPYACMHSAKLSDGNEITYGNFTTLGCFEDSLKLVLSSNVVAAYIALGRHCKSLHCDEADGFHGSRLSLQCWNMNAWVSVNLPVLVPG